MAAATCSRTSLFLFFFFFIISEAAAREYIVGGKPDAWKIPSSHADSLNLWAQSSRFQIGDSLVWSFNGEKDSVLQVNKKDYVNCNTSSPIESYKDGKNTKVNLDRSGPFYFISGAEGHCVKGQKLIVVVMSQKHSARKSGGFSPAPSPAAELEGPAVAPTSGAISYRGGSLVVSVFGALILGFLV